MTGRRGAWLLAGLLPLAAAAQSPVASELEERQTVRRARLPVYLDATAPGGCNGVRASQIRIDDGGVRRPALHLDAERLPVEHVLLIDSSESMVDRMQEVKRAAILYAAALPRDEAAMFATFDEDLLLHSPISRDRVAFEQSVRSASIGWGTHFWDSLSLLVEYLAPRRRRTVVVALSDGCDTDSDPRATNRRVIERAVAAASLTVYAIGLDLPRTCPGTNEDPRGRLRELAAATGGVYADIRQPVEIGALLERIRRRLDAERFVSYEPPAANHDPARRERRRLRVSLSGAPRCEIRLASSPYRRDPLDETFDRESRFSLEMSGPRAILSARVDDVLADSGRLAGRGTKLLETSTRFNPARRRGMRDVSVTVPPLARQQLASRPPEFAWFGALMQLLAVGPAAETGEDAWTGAPFLIHGRTLLDNRLAFGRALAEHPEYGAWARARAREARLAELERLAAELGAAQAAALEPVLEEVRSPAWDPGADALVPYLSEWLGDVPALRLQRASESWLIKRLALALARDPTAPLPEAMLRQTDAVWSEIDRLLGEQRSARTLGLLVPAWSPAAQRVGFYRLVLPRPTTLLNVWHLSPDAPRGARLFAWAARDPEFRARFATEHLQVDAVRYRPSAADSGELLRLAGITAPADEQPSPLIHVELALGVAGEQTARARVGALFALRPFASTPTDEPLCLVVEPNDARRLGAVEALVRAKEQAAAPCVIPAGRLAARGFRRSGP